VFGNELLRKVLRDGKDSSELGIYSCSKTCRCSTSTEKPMRMTNTYSSFIHSLTHQWLYSPFKDLGHLTREVLWSILTLSRTHLDHWSACHKGLYLHRATQHTKTRTNIHAVSGIRTHDLSIQAIKALTSDRAATETNNKYYKVNNYSTCLRIYFNM
jgi:hypothetical protein